MRRTLLAATAFFAFSTASHAAENIKIGVVYALTGPYAVAGEDCKRGMELAAEQINAAGGIKSMHGAKIELVFGDSQSKPINAASEAERLITQEKVIMLAGPTTSGESLPMTQVAEKYGIPMVNTLAQNEAITGRGFKWIWSTTLLDSDYSNGLFQALDMVLKLDPKKNKVGFIYPGNEYGKSLLKLVEDGFEKRSDAKLVSSVEVGDRAQDYVQPVLKLKASAPDVVMAVGYFRNGVLLSKALDQLDFHPIVVATGGMASDPKLVEQIGPLVNWQFATTPFSADRPKAKAVAAAFEKRYSMPLTLNSAIPYQGMMVIAAALDKAGSTKPDAIAKGLGSVDIKPEDMVVSSNFVKFDEHGRNTGRATVITQFQNEKIVTVWPPEKAVGKAVLKGFGTK
jgi:branched-chain amino acid transport system substrate-binding protein